MKKNSLKFLVAVGVVLLVFIFIAVAISFVAPGLVSFELLPKNLSLAEDDSIEGKKSVSFQFGDGRSGGGGASGTWGDVLSSKELEKQAGGISNALWEDLTGADLSLIPERKFVENEFGEKILMEKGYFSK